MSATWCRYTGAPALVRDDDPLEVARILDLAFDAHQLFLRAAGDAARRQVLVGGAHRLHDLVDADAEALQLFGMQENLHLPLDRAADAMTLPTP